MSAGPAVPGLALWCDARGLVERVIRDELGVDGLAPGQPLQQLVAVGSRTKLLNFMVELRSQGAVFDWEVNFLCGGRPVPLRLGGAHGAEGWLILGARTPGGMLNLWDELISINNEQLTALRGAIKSQIQAARAPEPDAPAPYDDLSRLNNELVTLQRDLAKKNAELERLYAEVQRLAITDPLTGLLNRRGFFENGAREVARARRYGTPLAAIMLDLDHFKDINDTHGHAVGDQVVAHMAARCVELLRQVDLLGRYGGEEFVLLLPGTTPEGALNIAERLRRAFEDPLPVEPAGLIVTLSLGVAALTDRTPDLEALLQAADRALYKAKAAGRNRAWLEPG